MSKFKIFVAFLALAFIGVGITACLAEESLIAEESSDTLGDTCLTLSASIAEAPGVNFGEADYERYADLNVPPLHPDEAMDRFQLEEGFRIELVAHEPIINHPVAMDIDSDGRLWVVDMPSYMPVVDEGDWETAVREQVPQGRVVILEDTSGDGVMETHRIFREGLVLPRAIKVLSDGILVGEPPHVWFIQDTTGDGKGDSREVVYDRYGDPNVSNVETLPNGLMWGMDNWLHNSDLSATGAGAESLRRVGGEWQTRPFEGLGQWGMTQDNWGRPYSANNTQPLMTHLVPYGYSERHLQFNVSAGINASIAPNEPMWPAHAVGSNRSYQIGEEVREDGTLRRATSTLAPVIYRGHQFGEEFQGDVIVPEPAGNLIKRYILDSNPAEIEAEARFAYEGREFLTSTDERFRPVNTYNAPDGSIYVVDMYHGIIQHARFLTDHLRDYVTEQGLNQGNHEFGRIYRIVRDDRDIDYNPPQFSAMTPQEVVEYLGHENGHLRDQAQQVLAQCSPDGVTSSLDSLADDASAEAYTRLQALWTLEGMARSTFSQDELSDLATRALDDSHPRIRAAAVRILEPAITESAEDVLDRLETLAETESSPFVQLQLLASLGESADESVLPLMARILNKNADSPYFREIALSGVHQREDHFARILRSDMGWSEEEGDEYATLLTMLDEVDEEDEETLDHLSAEQRELFEGGRALYAACGACHGNEGQGVSGIGPPLSGSEWAQAAPDAVVRIVLQGFEGGVAERPRQAVNIAGVMPEHDFLADEDIAAILTFIRQSWDNDAAPIEAEEVAQIREESSNRSELWTPDELRGMMDE